MKVAERWQCDVCNKQEISEFFPQDWFHVDIHSGWRYYGFGDNRDILKDCCSKKCLKLATIPLVEE